jgi:hypothetical protein
MLRARPSGQTPCRHAVELEASWAGASAVPAIGETTAPGDTPAATNRPPVRIEIRTEPPGALVYVDRSLHAENEQIVRTPCTITVPEGGHRVRLTMEGYQDGVFDGFDCRDGKVLAWTFRKEAGLQETQVRVLAIGRWKSSGVSVRAGEQIAVEASGTWSCGVRREPVDGNGYPNDPRFFFYYVDPKRSPRQVKEANYGALLMRVGPGGEPIVVGSARRLTVPASGTLYFDINETDDFKAREDNAGSLQVRIRTRAASAPAAPSAGRSSP